MIHSCAVCRGRTGSDRLDEWSAGQIGKIDVAGVSAPFFMGFASAISDAESYDPLARCVGVIVNDQPISARAEGRTQPVDFHGYGVGTGAFIGVEVAAHQAAIAIVVLCVAIAPCVGRVPRDLRGWLPSQVIQ